MVRVPFGQPYRGPGGPNPKLTREQRRQELERLAQTADGRDIILLLTHEATDTPLGTMLPVGQSYGHMVEQILDHEYPAS